MQEVFETVAPREQIEKVVDALTTTVVAAKEMKTTVRLSTGRCNVGNSTRWLPVHSSILVSEESGPRR